LGFQSKESKERECNRLGWTERLVLVLGLRKNIDKGLNMYMNDQFRPF